MKRSFVIFIAIALIAALGAACAPAKKGTLKIATNAEFAPFEYVDEQSKEIVGFDIDLINELAKRGNLEIEIINTGFDPMLAGLGQCQYDAAIAGITITDERKASMLFTQPYTIAGQTVVVRKGTEGISGPETLSGKKVGAQIGTTGAEEVSKVNGAELKTYDNYPFAFQDLINGQIDAVVVDNPVAQSFIARNPDKVEIIANVFTNETFGIAVCTKNEDLLKTLDKYLAEMKSDGSLLKLEEKWLVPQE